MLSTICRGALSILASAKLALLVTIGAAAAALAYGGHVKGIHESTCFGSQIDHPRAQRIARNTVFIAKVRADGTVISEGSGFVVRGGAAGEPRIVTAAHVVDPGHTAPEAILMVFLSDGAPVGVPRVVAAAPKQTISIADDDLVVNDIAVLEIARFASAAVQNRFADLDGLSVRAGTALMVGETSGSTGVIWGYSGGPAVDGDGEVVGVLTGADFRDRTEMSLGAIQETDADGQQRNRDVTLPKRSLVVVEPLRAAEILRELNLSAADGMEREETSVVLAGFPFASCASTSARLQMVDSLAGTGLLKKWQLIDQVGAWWLPSEFGGRKLRLAPG